MGWLTMEQVSRSIVWVSYKNKEMVHFCFFTKYILLLSSHSSKHMACVHVKIAPNLLKLRSLFSLIALFGLRASLLSLCSKIFNITAEEELSISIYSLFLCLKQEDCCCGVSTSVGRAEEELSISIYSLFLCLKQEDCCCGVSTSVGRAEEELAIRTKVEVSCG